MYTAAIRDLSTNKFTRLNSKNVFDIVPNMRVYDAVFSVCCDGISGIMGNSLFALDKDLTLICSGDPNNATDEDNLYHYYNELTDIPEECYRAALRHEKIDGFDDDDPRCRRNVDTSDYNNECEFDLDHVNTVYNALVEHKVHSVNFHARRLIKTRTGIKSRGILIVQPVIESVSWTDEQRDLMISIAKDNNWSLEYFHEAPDGYDDRQAGLDDETTGDPLPYGDYVELVYKGLD